MSSFGELNSALNLAILAASALASRRSRSMSGDSGTLCPVPPGLANDDDDCTEDSDMLLRCPAGRVDPTPDDPRFSLILANSPPDLGGELDMDSPDGGDFSAVGPELVRPATALAFAGGVLVALDDALDDDLDDVESVDAGRDPLDWTEFMDVFRWNVMPSNWLISSPLEHIGRDDRDVGVAVRVV